MYNTHPTLIDQNSRFYNESAKLACIFYDISVKQESKITQSAPEQVERVWVSASEGARWVIGLLSNMPMPEAHEPRGGLAVHLAIWNRGCEPEGVFIDLTIQLKNAPSSEPDAGERHVPYAVFKPIKDGINSFVRDITKLMDNSFNDLEGNGKSRGGSRGTNDGVDAAQFVKDFWNIITSGGFFYGLLIISIVIAAINTILLPFTAIVSGLANMVLDFLKPMIIKALVAISLTVGTATALCAGIELLNAAIYMIKPEADPFWVEGAGLAIIGAIASFVSYYNTVGLSLKIGSEFIGLVFAVMGLVVAVLAPGDMWYAFAGFLLAAGGFGLTIPWHPTDTGALGQIEEIVSGVAFAYSIANFFNEVDIYQ